MKKIVYACLCVMLCSSGYACAMEAGTEYQKPTLQEQFQGALDYRSFDHMCELVRADVGHKININAQVPEGFYKKSTALILCTEEQEEYKKDDAKQLFTLLLSRPDLRIDAVDEFGVTALMIASRYGNIDMVKQLITHKDTAKIINMQNTYQHFSALMWAARARQVEVVELLLTVPGIKRDLTTASQFGETAFDIALESAINPNRLSEDGKNAKQCAGLIKINGTDRQGRTLFMLAAQEGDAEWAQWLIQKGADINVQTSQAQGGMTALMYAVAGRHVDIVRMLLENPNLRTQSDFVNAQGLSAYKLALNCLKASANNFDKKHAFMQIIALFGTYWKGYDLLPQMQEKYVVEPFLNDSTMSNQEKLFAILELAYQQKCNPLEVLLLLDLSGIDINGVTPEYKQNALIYVCRMNGKYIEVEELFDEIFTKNPAVSLIDSNGGTALMYALDHSNFYMAEKLLEKGADGRGVFNDTKMTSLMLAVEKCDLDSVTLLLQRDHTQKDAKNAEEKTALDLACEQYLLQNEDEFGCHYDQKTHDTCTKIIELLGGTVPSATPEVPGEVPMVTEPKPVPPINVLPVLPIVAPHVPKPEEIKVPDQTHNTVQKPVKQPSVVNEKKQPISFKNTFKKVFKKWALPGLVTIAINGLLLKRGMFKTALVLDIFAALALTDCLKTRYIPTWLGYQPRRQEIMAAAQVTC